MGLENTNNEEHLQFNFGTHSISFLPTNNTAPYRLTPFV